MGSLHQRHLMWYIQDIAPILKEAERVALQLVCCDAERATVLRACFQEFRAGLLAGIAHDSRRWDHDCLVEHREKSMGTIAVRHLCLHLIKQLRKSR